MAKESSSILSVETGCLEKRLNYGTIFRDRKFKLKNKVMELLFSDVSCGPSHFAVDVALSYSYILYLTYYTA